MKKVLQEEIDKDVAREVALVFSLSNRLPATRRGHGGIGENACNNPKCERDHRGGEPHTWDTLEEAARQLRARGLIGEDVLAEFSK